MRVPGEPVLPCFRINQTFCREIALNLGRQSLKQLKIARRDLLRPELEQFIDYPSHLAFPTAYMTISVMFSSASSTYRRSWWEMRKETGHRSHVLTEAILMGTVCHFFPSTIPMNPSAEDRVSIRRMCLHVRSYLWHVFFV